MRKLTTLIAAAGIAFPAQVAVVTPAHAGYNTLPAGCKRYVASGVEPETNVGECISLLTLQIHYNREGKNPNAFAEHACDYYSEVIPDIFYSIWDTKQECMDEILSD